jgi:hypothetical protein
MSCLGFELMHTAEKLASFSWLSLQEKHLLPLPFSSLGQVVSEEQGERDTPILAII